MSLKDLYEEMTAMPVSEKPEPKEYERVFNRLLDFLRSEERLPAEIRALAKDTWQWIQSQTLQVAVDPAVPSIHIEAYRTRTSQHATLLLPSNFLVLVQQDPAMQLGSLFNISRRAQDFVERRLGEETALRGSTSEAILLHALGRLHREEGISHEWNAYQQQVLQRFPNTIH